MSVPIESMVLCDFLVPISD